MRKTILKISEDLVDKGLLENKQENFKLSFDNLKSILESEENINRYRIIENIEENKNLKKVFLKWNFSPLVIDSKGQVL